MKQILNMAIMMSVFAASIPVWAGVERFDSDEFNSIISENLKAEQDLREQLRANAGVPNVEKEMHPDFATKARELVGIAPSESVASPTTEHRDARRDRADKRADERNLKRVSEEIRELDAN